MNAEFCMELARELRASPSYGQDEFVCGPAGNVGGEDCLTPGCIAGHAVALGHRHEHEGRMVVPMAMALPGREVETLQGSPIAAQARNLMGITDSQAEALFEADPFSRWKEEVGNGEDPEEVLTEEGLYEYLTYATREDAADVVEAMVASGGTVDWRAVWDGAIG